MHLIDFLFKKGSEKSQFSQDINKMYAIFKSLHPPNALMKDCGVIKKCIVALKNEFPEYHDELLKNTSEVFTFRRLRLINQKMAKKSKKGAEPSHAMTRRGAYVNLRNAFLN